MKISDPLNTNDLSQVLLRMHRTGHYYPTATWVVPTGGRGMSKERADAAWIMAVHPALVTMEHIEAAYFMNPINTIEGRYFVDNTPAIDLKEIVVDSGALA